MGHDCNKVAKGGISTSLHYDSVATDTTKPHKNFIHKVLCLLLTTTKKVIEVKSTYVSDPQLM